MTGDPAPRFLCDRMLMRLGRWLRAAGYDTAMAEDHHDDKALVERARAERRLLLTCDRKMLEIRHADEAVLLIRDGRLGPSIRELAEHLGLDWLKAPLSRCLDCNAAIEPAPAALWRQVPDGVPQRLGPLTRCTGCGKLYWQGGHAERIHTRLARWQSGELV
jgi:uncharacterized protein with PIN domain